MKLVGRRTLFVMGLFGSLTAVALVLMAEGVARGVTGAIAGDDLTGAALLLAGGGIIRALCSWASQAYAVRAGIGAKEQLRRDLAKHVLETGGGRSGTLAATSLGLDELAAWYRTVLPAMTATATIPLIVGARVLVADWLSALIIVLTVPLVPTFMVLVGLHTRDRSNAATATLDRLSDHLVELARGLPVLVGLGRLTDQAAALRRISEAHRETTMSTLRSAFLSSLVLELIATISVAIVAVAAGLRLMHGELSLEVGILALVLAPECYAPFRSLGASFHASREGLAAMRNARAVIDAPRADRVITEGVMGADSLTIRSIDSLSFSLPAGSTTLVEGPSGSGKSTLLEALAGVLPAEGIRGIDPARVAYVPQHPRTIGDTVRDELLAYGDEVDAVMHRLRLPNTNPAQLSPGELRRLAVARGVLRVNAGATLLLLDEPTAHLDAASAALIERELELLQGRVTMVIASHEQGVARLADRRIVLAPSTFRAPERVEPVETHLTEVVSTGSTTEGAALPELIDFLRPTAWRFAMAVVLGTAATLFAIALLAVSAWLIVRASQEPAIMYLLLAIVGVRFFGLGRAVLRYSERLLTHDASLGAVTELRLRLWNGLAAHGPASRTLTTGGVALDYLVAAADRVRDLVPRVVLPIVTAAASTLAVAIAVAALYAPALPALVVVVAALVIAPAVALWADRRASEGEALTRSTVLRRFVALVEAAPDIAANGVGERVRDELSALDAVAGAQARRSAIALGLGSAVVVAACGAASALMLTASAGAAPALIAVLVLLPLGLIDPLLALVDAVQQWPALAAALRRVGAIASDQLPAESVSRTVQSLELRDLATTWPGAGAAAFSGVNALAHRGDWVVIEGASGSGKSTLLATVLGFVRPSRGAVLFDGQPDQPFVAWCPQEAHLFDSTIRGNLLLPRGKDDKPVDAELTAALTRVGLFHGLDYRVGHHGVALSGGERQRLAVARALLTRADVVLLDEPTAHLDADAADALMRDLRAALADRIVVLVTHHASEAGPADIRLRLGALPATV